MTDYQNPVNINIEMIKRLIDNQFPKWSNLEIKPVEKSGHDNRTFHLGEEMAVRLPSGSDYVLQVEKEYKWLPVLGKYLSLPISSPIAKGLPSEEYPFPWTINKYIKGQTLNHENILSKNSFAAQLSDFLKELQEIDTKNAPLAGKHNFYRGGDLSVYHKETVSALEKFKDILPVKKLSQIWQCALSSTWNKKAVWLHGDIAPGNLLVMNGNLCAVIDFGIMAVGDPSCDYAMAWTFFDKESRAVFLNGLDIDTIYRAKAWALWKALITYDDTNSKHTIKEILSEEM